MENNPIRLSARLSMIAEMLPQSQRYIDVGSDHGMLIAHLLETHPDARGIATDIHEAPAQRTAAFLRERSLTDRCEVYCTDGFGSLTPMSGDAAILSGMGAYEIMHILDDLCLRHSIPKEWTLLLQPQKNFTEMREYLTSHAWQIIEERIICDREKWYTAIRCMPGDAMAQLTLTESFLGPYLIQNPPLLWLPYLRHQKAKLEKIVKGKPDYQEVWEAVDRWIKESEAQK